MDCNKQPVFIFLWYGISMVEGASHKRPVDGSSPSRTTTVEEVVQLVRTPGCGPGGQEFESLLSPHASKRE